MNRRTFLRAITGFVIAPLAAEAQTEPKVWTIGSLSPATRSSTFATRDETVRQGLRELGWIEGRNIRIEYRWADGSVDRLAALAEELVRLRVDVMIVWTTPAAHAAKNATRTIPVVMGSVADPVASGLVASLARPGGNLTGVSLMAPELAGKRLELLRQLVPGLARVAFLAQGADPVYPQFVKEAVEAGQKIGIEVQPLIVRDALQLEAAFTKLARDRVGGIIVQPLFVTATGQGRRIAELAAQHRLPTISDGYQFASQGGLIYYGPDRVALDRRVPMYVDRILKGAKPGDLPVEQPTKFELVINLKAAKALGLTIPPSLLLRADQVIE